MPKLTINSVCTKGAVCPMIFNFQNGYPCKDFECRCSIIQNNNGGKKTIAAEIGRILYVGVEETDNMGQTLLLVRNRKTGKVRLIETSSAEMKPMIDNISGQCTQTRMLQENNSFQEQQQLEPSDINLNRTPIHIQSLETSDTELNLSIHRHSHIEKPTKRGSTARFSQSRSRQFHHLCDFVVDEIIPNQRSDPECNKSPKSIYSLETNKLEEFRVGATELNEANKIIASKTLSEDLLEKKETNMETEGVTSININLSVDVGIVGLKEANKMNESKELTGDILVEKGTAMDTKGVAKQKKITIDTDPEELQISEIIANKEIPKVVLGEKGIDLETEGITCEDANSTIDIEKLSILSPDALSVDTTSDEIIVNKEIPKVVLGEKGIDLETEGITCEDANSTINIEKLSILSPDALSVDTTSDKIIVNKEIPKVVLGEKGIDLETEGITCEDANSTIDIEKLSILSPDALSVDTTSDEIIVNKKIPKVVLGEKGIDLETEGITCEDANSTIDIEKLSILSPDALSVDTTSDKIIVNKEIPKVVLGEKGIDLETEGITCEDANSTIDIEKLSILPPDALSVDTTSDKIIANKEISKVVLGEKGIELETEGIICEDANSTIDIEKLSILSPDALSVETTSNKIIANKEIPKVVLGEKGIDLETEGITCEDANSTIDIEKLSILSPDALSVDTTSDEIIVNKEIPKVVLGEKGIDLETEGITCEDANSTIDIEKLSILSPDALSVDTTSDKIIVNKEIPKVVLGEKGIDLETEGITCEDANSTIDIEKLTILSPDALSVDTTSDEIIANKEIPKVVLGEKEIEFETEGITCEDANSTIDIEKLTILSPDALSVDTTSEFEGENQLNTKLNPEEHEEHQTLKHKNYSSFVAALELDSTTKQNSDSWIRSNNLINGRANNYSVSSNCTENIYVCNYCEAVFDNKGSLIFHLISHKLVINLVNDVTQSDIRTNIGNERNVDVNEKFNESKYGEGSKRKNRVGATTKNVMYEDKYNEDNTLLKTKDIAETDCDNKENGDTGSKYYTNRIDKFENRKMYEKYNEDKDTFTENTYNCDCYGVAFENRGSLVFHQSSHEFLNIDHVTESKVKRIKRNDIKENKNNNSYSESDCNMKEKKKINPDLNEISTEIQDSESSTRKFSLNMGQSIIEKISICDYCETGYENKGSRIFHIISHKLNNNTDIITQSKTEKIKETGNETEIPSQNTGILKKQKKISPDFTELFKNTQVSSEQNGIDCTYKDKELLIVHQTSHEHLNDTDTGSQLRRSERTKGKDNDKNKNGNGLSENNRNPNNKKNEAKRNPDLNVKSKNFKDHVKRSKDDTCKATKTKLQNADEGKHIANIETEMEKITGKVTHVVPTTLINCKRCSSTTDDMSNILNHSLTHAKGNSNKCYICNDCGNEFKSKASIIIHLESHNNNSNRRNSRMYRCTTCKSSFNTKSVLINHQTKMHPKNPNKCTLCDYTSSSAHKLTVHKQTHKTKPFRCTICKCQCNEKNFVKHMKSHTDSRRLQCKLCDSKFTCKSAQRQHMIKHSGKKEHQCTICDSTFSWPQGLKRHTLIHLKDKPYKCEECSAGFKIKYSLTAHQKIHSGERDFKCTHCEYSCITSDKLKSHLKTHVSKSKLNQKSNLKRVSSDVARPFQCTMCHCKYKLKHSLVNHMKKHTGEQPVHECTFCDKTFFDFSSLKRHIKVHS